MQHTKRKQTMKGIIKFFCLSLLLQLSSAMMTYAQSINFKDYFPPKGYRSGMTVLNATGAGCQFTFKKGEKSKSGPVYYNGVSFYRDNILIIDSDKKIASLTFHFLEKGKDVKPTNETCTVNVGTFDTVLQEWTGKSNHIVLTFVPPSKKKFTLERVDVTFETENSNEKEDKNIVATSIASFKKIEKDTLITLKIQRATVLYQYGNEMFIQDKSGGICITVADSVSFKKGDIIRGHISGKHKEIQQTPYISDIKSLSLRTIGEEPLQPQAVNAEQLKDHLCEYVTTTCVQDSAHISIKDKFAVGCSVYSGAHADCSGIVVRDNENLLLYPVEPKAIKLTFADDKENLFGDAIGVDVTIRRTLKANQLNTLTLPCNLSQSQVIEVFGTEAVVAKYVNTDKETLTFQKETTGIKASTPYLVMPSKDVEEIVLTNVNLSEPKKTMRTATAFIGILQPVALPEACCYLSNGTIQSGYQGARIKAFRAYFSKQANAEHKNIRIENIATAVIATTINTNADNQPVYSISGYRMPTGKHLPKGVYIIGDKKVVIR